LTADAAPPKAPARRFGPGAWTDNRKEKKGKQRAYNGNPLDPEHNSLIPVSAHEGKAFAVTDIVRLDSNATTGYKRLFILCNTGVSGSVLLYVTVGVSASTAVHTVPTLALDANNGGPTAGRAMKCGLKVVNTVSPLTMGGRVYMLNASQRVALAGLPSTMTAAEWTEFITDMKAHPKCQAYSAADFRIPKKFVCTVANNPEYHSYDNWGGTLSVDQFAAHFAVWPTSTETARPMSVIFFLIEDPPATQGYTLTAMGSWYTRWPLESVLGRSMKDVPTTGQAALNALHKKAETAAETGDGTTRDVGGAFR